MRIHTTQVFNFNELSDEAKEKAIENNRDINVDYDNWYDYIYEDTKTIAGFLGFEVGNIYFTGFASQGDGACFTGTWESKDMKLKDLMEYAPQDEELHRIGKQLSELIPQGEKGFCRITHSGRYYHEFCTSFPEVEFLNDADEDEHITQEIFSERETELVTLSRDFMRWIYKYLEKEYNYLTADEQVKESIISNEMEFTEDGRDF